MRLPRTLSALPLVIFFAFFGSHAQAQSARPVARLIASTTAPPSARAVTTSSVCSTRVRYEHASFSGATSQERRLFDLVNRERAQTGERPLEWDADAARMAREHSDEMARGNFLSHTDGSGRNTFARAASEGVCGWQALGENIAYNQGYEDPVAFAVERWMQSAKHRENILRAQFTHAAVGIAKAPDGTVYFTQVFVTR